MPMDKSGKYHMNPHNAKAADSASPRDPAAAAPSGDADMDPGADQGGMMMTCPACGTQFPEEMGIAPAGAAAPEQPSQPSGGSAPALTGY